MNIIMIDNVEILNKLYSVKKMLSDKTEIDFIDNMISKRNCEINVDFECTNKEKYSSNLVFIRISNSIFKEPDPWTLINGTYTEDSLDNELFDKLELFNEDLNLLINKFSLIRIKNNKTKNKLTKQNSILIQNIFIEEHNQLVKKYKL